MDQDNVWQVIANEWRKAGMSDQGIAGVLANVREESNFNPNLRHPDQPNWGGEAHYAHGLYQEGGQEWNHYTNWLNQNYPGKSWQDPRLQSEFAATNLRDNYPQVWKTMNEAGSPIQAGASYASGYLKPAAQYLSSRIANFQRNGIPTLDDYTNGTANYRPSTSPAAPSLVAANAPTSPAEPAPQPAGASGSAPNPLASLSSELLSQANQRPAAAPAPGSLIQQMSPPAARLRDVLARMYGQQQASPFPDPINQGLIDAITKISS